MTHFVMDLPGLPRHTDLTNDDDIVRAVQQGDQTALGVLYSRYFPAVWRYVCVRLGGNQHDAEDVVSETWIAAIRGIHGFDSKRGVVYGWLVGIAKNKVNDFLRRKKRTEPLSVMFQALPEPPGIDE